MTIKAYWKFNGNGNDYSGNGNNLTLTGLTNAQGIENGAYLFDSASDMAQVANSSILDFERTDAFSVSCWFRLNTLTNGSEHIFVAKKTFVSGWAGWEVESVYVTGSGLELIFDLANNQSTSNWIEVYAFVPVVANKWYNFTVTYSGNSSASGCKFYFDGKLIPLSIWKNSLTSSIKTSAIVTVGNGYNSSNKANFDGSIDNTSIHAAELTAGQVKNIFASGKGFF